MSRLDVSPNYLPPPRPRPRCGGREQTVNTEISEIISTSNTSHLPLPSLPPRTAGQCETIAGDQCLFPFTYRGTTYYSCTVEDSDNGSPWCAVQVRPGPSRTVLPGKWDDCSPGERERWIIIVSQYEGVEERDRREDIRKGSRNFKVS